VGAVRRCGGVAPGPSSTRSRPTVWPPAEHQGVGPAGHAEHGEAARDVVNGVSLMAWAMAASAMEGVGDKAVRSAHGVFARPTSRAQVIDLALDRFSTGRAFGTDTITVTQGARARRESSCC